MNQWFQNRHSARRQEVATLKRKQKRFSWQQRLQMSVLMGSIAMGFSLTYGIRPAQAQLDEYCRLDPAAITEKDKLRDEALGGNRNARRRYAELLEKHHEDLDRCRQTYWPRHQSVWLRAYPCDIQAGVVERILDDIVNKGYDHLYLEVFGDGRVLLPQAQNNTPWSSRIQETGQGNRDLLAEIIEKGRARGLKVYAWLFGMNYGYSYSQRRDRQDALARNGSGQISVDYVPDGSQAFIDPYNDQAIADYSNLVNQVLQRQPDGMLFDYIRYPRGSGTQSVATTIEDLWIYSSASAQAMYSRAENKQGLALIEKYFRQGTLSVGDVSEVLERYPEEDTPRWQSRFIRGDEAELTISQQHARLVNDLWIFSVSHAAQGVLDFVTTAAARPQRRNIPAGAVFFPGGNKLVGQRGFDSRLQPWDYFPPSLEWHAMSYAVCGRTDCIMDEINRVRTFAPEGTKIIPALAGHWERNLENRPSLRQQMAALEVRFPDINHVSHFAYSWLEPEFDNDRKFCRV